MARIIRLTRIPCWEESRLHEHEASHEAEALKSHEKPREFPAYGARPGQGKRDVTSEPTNLPQLCKTGIRQDLLVLYIPILYSTQLQTQRQLQINLHPPDSKSTLWRWRGRTWLLISRYGICSGIPYLVPEMPFSRCPWLPMQLTVPC